jgi:ribonuclease VapC
LIVDTSALAVISRNELGWERLAKTIFSGDGFIPAPVLVEFHSVTKCAGNQPDPDALLLVDEMLSGKYQTLPFDASMAQIAVEANAAYGTGNGKGGLLNMLDLMVYAASKASDRPILCTGKDFGTTDAAIHPASRIG